MSLAVVFRWRNQWSIIFPSVAFHSRSYIQSAIRYQDNSRLVEGLNPLAPEGPTLLARGGSPECRAIRFIPPRMGPAKVSSWNSSPIWFRMISIHPWNPPSRLFGRRPTPGRDCIGTLFLGLPPRASEDGPFGAIRSQFFSQANLVEERKAIMCNCYTRASGFYSQAKNALVQLPNSRAEFPVPGRGFAKQ